MLSEGERPSCDKVSNIKIIYYPRSGIKSLLFIKLLG